MPIEQRPYQARIITKTMAAYERDLVSVLIESPTGSGKTIMAMEVAKQMARQGFTVGWVAQRRNLLKQARKENVEKGFMTDIQFVSLFQSDLPEVDFLVLDECHHQACNTCVSLLNRIKPKKFLGMSATPFRTDRMQLSFQKIIKDAGIHMLIQQGFLAPYQHWVIPHFDPASVADVFAREREKWGKSLIFFLSTAECYQCQLLLAQKGVKSEVVTANTDRDTQLEKFENGEVDVLINVFILTEGFDCPTLRTVFIRPSGKGPSIQMGGRVFRKHPDKPLANIVQCKETRFAFPQKVTAQKEWVWEREQWMSVQGNENVEIAQANSMRIIAQTLDQSLPTTITSAMSRRRRRRMRRDSGMIPGMSAAAPSPDLVEIE